ncbi:hypothetical protein O4160_10640 [Rhodococcus sp. IEGM 1401]|jgi:hypothetical protein|uniref:Uncharacterized protein n=1 Tax=Rhodococcus cercidiphylli TaxID=489916 RepID=A0ABU4AVM7_9NOCA|nr:MULTISPECIES: hypothetical protein [Rhodococcus]MCZ4561288.1 hypothetical protein [Rhodococcus sp. IEGM 1401]MDI9921431.1 hypothetical protein [Rhodococcus sp. IEGM 1372]MDV6230288.1 hypothetical protein [Rhodococcus cercidiphylli]MDV8033782.1 hypothetical protein [Rhodococcus sp. IEGM 1414]
MSERTDILTRYQAYRTRRFLENDAKTRHWLPAWRTQHRRRILVVALSVVLFSFFVISITSLFVEWAAIAWIPAVLLFLPIWTALQTVSGRHGDAPVGALDEWEVQQRNEARSIGLTITQTLVMAAAFASIFLSTANDEMPRLAYAGGGWTLAALLAGICSPAMILAWITPDPELEDTEDFDPK